MGEGGGATALAEHEETEAALPYRGSVQLLVFELQGQRYGVDVAEIEAIVQASALRHDEGTFAYGEEEVTADSLARWVGLGSRDEAAAGQATAPGAEPQHLLLSRSGGVLNGLLVDMPRDIVSMPLEAIYALPPLIRRLLADSPLWGVGRAEEGLILLVDPSGRHRPGRGSGQERELGAGPKREPEEEL